MSTDVSRLEKRLALGDRVNQLRRRKGWTTRDLAKHAGTSDSYVSRLETGATARPRYEDIEKIAQAFGVSSFWLLNGYDPVASNTSADERVPHDPGVRSAAFKIFERFEHGSDADKEYIRRHLEMFARGLD